MADRVKSSKDIWNDDDEEDRPPKRSRLKRFLWFVLVLLAVLLVVLAAAWRDGTGLDSLRRYFAYGRDKGETGYVYDASSSNRFALLGDTLAVLSDTTLALVDGAGNTVWSTSVNMGGPALYENGNLAVAYDVGGTELYVVNDAGLCYQLTAQNDEPYISATLNDEGDLTVTARKRSCKAAISVYDRTGDLIFTFNSSERFVSNAYTEGGGEYLAAVTLGQSGGAFASSVVLYALTGTEPVGGYELGSGMCLDMGGSSKHILMLCDDALRIGSTGNALAGTYDYGGSFLREYDLHGEDYAVLLLNRYQSGSVGRLVTVGMDGKEIASLAVSDEILSVSARGRYIAVLYTDKLVIYNAKLERYASLNGTDYAREALAGADGSALLVTAERATRFLP